MVDHDGKLVEAEEERNSEEIHDVLFYPRQEQIEPLESKATENQLKPSATEPLKLALKELPEHLEYDFLQGDDQLPVVISSALSVYEMTKLLVFLKNTKGAIAWSITDIKGIDSSFCTHKILMEDEFKPTIQPQRRVNPNIKKLNVATQNDHFSLPFIDQMLEQLAGHEYYCFMDGFLGRMTFKLCNAPATFQRCMIAIFHELIKESMEEKCQFMVREGIVLDHNVSRVGIEVDRAKIESISKLSYPTNTKAIRSFLGHACFYRRFIKDFSQVTRPMTQLLVKDAPFVFSEECMQAFDRLKPELTQAPIMIKPDWSLPFKIMCDDSDYAVGGILGQRKDKHF
ncbi:reverse transcriptase domain-containing protein [Tanacetum coccineum]